MLALAASAAILLGWLYFFPPPKQPQNANANANANANSQQLASPSASPTAQVASATPVPAPAASPEATPETVPQRKLHIVTPLYEATFDTRGAVVTSWILTKIKRSDGTLKNVYGAS